MKTTGTLLIVLHPLFAQAFVPHQVESQIVSERASNAAPYALPQFQDMCRQFQEESRLRRWRLSFLSYAAITFSAPAALAVSGGGLDYANLDISGQDFSHGNYKGKDFTQGKRYHFFALFAAAGAPRRKSAL
jgi:hypothetical protein